MFDNLIESEVAPEKRIAELVTSVLLHGMLIAASVYATARIAGPIEGVRAEPVRYVAIERNDPPPPSPEVTVHQELAIAPPPPGFQILVAPVSIPDVIPAVDFSAAITLPENFAGRGTPGGTHSGVPGGIPRAIAADQPLSMHQVEIQVRPAAGNRPPPYPSLLRQNCVEGTVTAQFVVDTTGRADTSSFRAIGSTHALFTAAVRDHLATLRFTPAELGGRKVRQLVQMPFLFSVACETA